MSFEPGVEGTRASGVGELAVHAVDLIGQIGPMRTQLAGEETLGAAGGAEFGPEAGVLGG